MAPTLKCIYLSYILKRLNLNKLSSLSILLLTLIAIRYRISGFIRWEVIFAFFASDEEFAKIVKLLLCALLIDNIYQV